MVAWVVTKHEAFHLWCFAHGNFWGNHFHDACHCGYVCNERQSVEQTRKFDTGATRDKQEGKPQYSKYLDPEVLQEFGRYMLRHQIDSAGVARAGDNWKKGMPQDVYLDSMVRHMIDLWAAHEAGDPTSVWTALSVSDAKKDLCCAIIFNAQGYLRGILRGE